MRCTFLLILIAFLAPLFAVPALAHGGIYRGPTALPWPPPPPSPAPPPGGFPGRATPGRPPRGGVTGPDVRVWSTWWAYNKEEFLPSRGTLRQGIRLPGYDTDGGSEMTPEQLREALLPVLQKLVTDEKNADIRDSAALAIGKIGDVREYRFLEGLLGDRHRTVIEASILGLGLLREDRSERKLIEVARDSNRSARERGFAVMALGLSGGDMAREALVDKLGVPSVGGFSSRSRAANLETLRALAAALCARSDLRPTSEPLGSNPVTGALVKALRMDRVKERTFLPIGYSALAKTADGAAAKAVLDGLRHRKAVVRGGAAIAAGRVIREPTKKQAHWLGQVLAAEGDLFPRRMLLISLGRMGGTHAIKLLRSNLTHKDRQHRAFAALALAIAGDSSSIGNFRKGLARARDASLTGAYGVALGLLGDRGAVPLILETIEKNKNPDVRAHLVEALTVMGDRSVNPVIEKLLVKTRSNNLQAACAQGLGLLGAWDSLPIMLKLLRDSRELTVRGALAAGLGRMGDPRVLKPLLEFVQDESHPDLARAFVASALGIFGEKNPGLPPFARTAIDAHYDLRLNVLDELRGLL